MNTDRRTFLREACTSGICGCLCGAAASAVPADAYAAAGEPGQEHAVAGQPGPSRPPAGAGAADPAVAAQDDQMPRAWIAALLPALGGQPDRAAARTALRAAAAAHWENLRMDEKVAPFRGDMDALLTFLTTQWGWKIERPSPGVIVADEGKSYCVCPLVPKGSTSDLTMLCHCSEGFAERLFGAVAGHPVKAEVSQSVLRGATSCRYRVTGV